MHPDGITILYGQGGVGKGWVACYAITALVAEGYFPCVLDFEGYRYEWLQRLYWMGIREDDGVGYLNVDTNLTREVAGEIAEALDAGYTHVILDSVSMAKKMSRESDSGGWDVAVDMFRAIKLLERPTLALAHQAKRSTGPIGSVQYTNQARLVWQVTQPSNLLVEARMEKVNDRPRQGKPLTFSWVPGPDGSTDFVRGGQARSDRREAQEESTGNAILRILKAVDRSMDREQMQTALSEEGREVDIVKVGSLMRELHHKGRLTRVDRGRYAFPVPQEAIDEKA